MSMEVNKMVENYVTLVEQKSGTAIHKEES
jgi:hypothetical protein